MKKRKFNQFFKEYLGLFAIAIWMLLLCMTIAGFITENFPIWLKLSLFLIFILYTKYGSTLLSKYVDKQEKQKEESRNRRIQELKVQNKYYIDLVNRNIKDILKKFKNESLNISIDTSLEYLISFSNYLNWICDTRIVGKPDSFIIASCLMYSLKSNPVITINESDSNEYLESTVYSINLDIAMSCVLEIISEPITYFADNGIWVEDKHPKVNIVVHNGLIKNSELYKRILNTIYHDELSDVITSIMQFSNLLHLIYLNCQ